MNYRNQPRGEDNGNAKLTEADVRYVRLHNGATLEELAKIIGCHLTTVWLIRQGLTWRHVKP